MAAETLPEQPPDTFPRKLADTMLLPAAAFLTFVVYYFSNPSPQHFYDYTFRIAVNILGGHVAFTEPQPTWLNEFIEFGGYYYSAFPLGAVLTMIPFALPAAAGLINEMPGAFIGAITAAGICIFLLLIAGKYALPLDRKLLMSAGILFGTWMWTNFTFGGAWQLALGFAMLGELGAIYFSVYRPRPILAGAFFALAFGNRTEVLMASPVLLYLIGRSIDAPRTDAGALVPSGRSVGVRTLIAFAQFCVVPFILGVCTLMYNYTRFGSAGDFGYSRIPGVLNEPWYQYGIFSVWYIPRQAWEMLVKPWDVISQFPYLLPDGFSSSIIWSSPFLLFAFRWAARDRVLKNSAWAATILLTAVLWMHGNSGGWQFGYRYAIICLPWIFLVLLETAPQKIKPIEWAAYIFSFILNAYATWLFHWTEYIKP